MRIFAARCPALRAPSQRHRWREALTASDRHRRLGAPTAGQRRRGLASAVVACALPAFASLSAFTSAHAAAPVIFNTPHFESPVRGGPDDIVFLGGAGFKGSDRVVYQEMSEGDRSAHPAAVPTQSAAELGTATVIKVGDPPYSLTILLPEVLAADRSYRLWVVNTGSEWSQPFFLNDPRPLWVSPANVYATRDYARLGRRIRVVGRNLAVAPDGAPSTAALQIRLRGPQTYTLSAIAGDEYVAEAALPGRIAPGMYNISISRTGTAWADMPDQRLNVLPDLPTSPRLELGDPRFGSCSPDDDADDSACLDQAIEAALRAGGAVIDLAAGTWMLDQDASFTLPPNVSLEGAGAEKTTLHRRGSAQGPLLLLEGNNTLSNLGFTDEKRFTRFEDSRPVIQLGHRWDDPGVASGKLPVVVRDVAITDTRFRRVGMAVKDAGLPIERLVVTHNDFGGYARGLELPGASHSSRTLYRIDDAVIRWNRFVPGSFIDIPNGQGVIATGMGASRRVDFSSNTADGASTEALQDPKDPPGWRAAFFWNMNDSIEMLLLANNRISCSGDKAGDGEAIAFDANNTTYGYQQVAEVSASDTNSITLRGDLLRAPAAWAGGNDSYYVGHWVEVVAGPGMGQTRRIQHYRGDSGVFQVTPAWDVVPVPGQTKVIVGRQFWQTYVVNNEITQATPTCRKANPNGPKGGEITMWASSADSVIAGNRQVDTNGVGFTQGYSVRTPSCPTCDTRAAVQTALEIRENRVQGEYDWGSSCSLSGIHGTFGASPTPEAPPPILSFGVQITHNIIEHSDGLGGGAIDIVPTWHGGPEPIRYPLIDNLIATHNTIRDVDGPSPRTACHYAQRGRIGIRIVGGADVVGTVLYGNSCDKVGTELVDEGNSTTRVCGGATRGSCECRERLTERFTNPR